MTHIPQPGKGWAAQIRCAAGHWTIGYFEDRREAARAYDRAALEHFGEFAWLNFPEHAQKEER